jgi:hypothetical protein
MTTLTPMQQTTQAAILVAQMLQRDLQLRHAVIIPHPMPYTPSHGHTTLIADTSPGAPKLQLTISTAPRSNDEFICESHHKNTSPHTPVQFALSSANIKGWAASLFGHLDPPRVPQGVFNHEDHLTRHLAKKLIDLGIFNDQLLTVPLGQQSTDPKDKAANNSIGGPRQRLRVWHDKQENVWRWGLLAHNGRDLKLMASRHMTRQLAMQAAASYILTFPDLLPATKRAPIFGISIHDDAIIFFGTSHIVYQRDQPLPQTLIDKLILNHGLAYEPLINLGP